MTSRPTPALFGPVSNFGQRIIRQLAEHGLFQSRTIFPAKHRGVPTDFFPAPVFATFIVSHNPDLKACLDKRFTNRDRSVMTATVNAKDSPRRESVAESIDQQSCYEPFLCNSLTD